MGEPAQPSGGGKILNLNFENVASLIQWNKALEPLNRDNIKSIVLHHTASKSDSVQNIHRLHIGTWPSEPGFGYNFYIEKNRKLWIGRGFNKGTQTHNFNSSTLGVCAEGSYDVESPSDGTIQDIINVCAYLMQQLPSLQMNPNNIVPHEMYCSTACPGANMVSRLKHIRTEVGKLLGSGIAVQGYVSPNASYYDKNASPIPVNNSSYYMYVVRVGDTWEKIAEFIGVAKETLWRINELGPNTRLAVGQVILSPVTARTQALQHIDYVKAYSSGMTSMIKYSAEQSVRASLLATKITNPTPIVVSGDNTRHNLGNKFEPNKIDKFQIHIQDGETDRSITFKICPTNVVENHQQNVRVIKTKGGFVVSTERALSSGSISGVFLDMNGFSEKDTVIKELKNQIDNGRNVVVKMYLENSWKVVEFNSITVSNNPSNSILKQYNFSYTILKDARFMVTDGKSTNAYGKANSVNSATKSSGTSTKGVATQKKTSSANSKSKTSSTTNTKKTASKTSKTTVGAAKAAGSAALSQKNGGGKVITKALASKLKIQSVKK